ncbi:MAG: hypothetical protein ABFR75_10325 [Acidobacteriota bacterium]
MKKEINFVPELFFKNFIILMFVIIIILPLVSCNILNPKSNVPKDHDINMGGDCHKEGLYDPLNNCASCHGQNLEGSGDTPSCFQCHGKKW